MTKGAPFTGEMDTDADGNVTEPYILGHRDGNYYHKWANIQIVSHDIPLVLDALPAERGMTKDEIVDELLRYAPEMVDDISLMMMGREFDSDPVKDICEEYDVSFLNPKRKFAAQNETIEEMKQHGEIVRIVEQSGNNHPNRNHLFMPPTIETPQEETEDENGNEKPNHRREMCKDIIKDLSLCSNIRQKQL